MKFSTFSLVARDPETGNLAVAGGTNWFCYGRWVPHVEAGVGALATQAETNMWYAPNGIDDLRKGMSAKETVADLIKRDPDDDGVYQLLVIDNHGNTNCYTGKNNHVYAGHVLGENFGVAGNTLVNEDTLNAVRDTYLKEEGDFGLRIIKALQAGQKAGGDIRGMKSAALKIAKGTSSGKYWNDIIYDLRVDKHDNPIKELEHLYNTALAYSEIDNAESSENSEDVTEHYLRALKLDPENSEILFWIAWNYELMGKKELASKYMNQISDRKEMWEEYRKRLKQRQN